jgi:hypothetical protein
MEMVVSLPYLLLQLQGIQQKKGLGCLVLNTFLPPLYFFGKEKSRPYFHFISGHKVGLFQPYVIKLQEHQSDRVRGPKYHYDLYRLPSA